MLRFRAYNSRNSNDSKQCYCIELETGNNELRIHRPMMNLVHKSALAPSFYYWNAACEYKHWEINFYVVTSSFKRLKILGAELNTYILYSLFSS